MKPEDIQNLVRIALAEDVGSGDLTAALLPEDQQAQAHVIVREAAVLCGQAWFDEVFRQVDTGIKVAWLFRDGDILKANDKVCELTGQVRALLTGERTALNFLQTLSGTATATRAYVDAMSGTGCKLLDTRKTLPGLRQAQKYAVRCAGGQNHRMGLYDAVLIKENHIEAAGSIAAAVATAIAAHRQNENEIMIEVEVETLAQLDEALIAGAKRILLDNFDIATARQAVTAAAGRAQLEISGNIHLDNIREYAETGVDFISVGAITKHVRATDFSMRMI